MFNKVNYCFAASVHQQIRNRGIKVWMGLGRHFRSVDDSGEGVLNIVELDKGLVDYRVNVEQEVRKTFCHNF